MDPWFHSPSLKMKVTANIAPLLFSLTRLEAKPRRRGKLASASDGGVFWYQRPQQSGGNLTEMSLNEWNKDIGADTRRNRVGTRVFFSEFLFSSCFYQHSTWNSLKKKILSLTSQHLLNADSFLSPSDDPRLVLSFKKCRGFKKKKQTYVGIWNAWNFISKTFHCSHYQRP